MSDEPDRPVVPPQVLLDHTEGLVLAVQRYHEALARMLAAEHTVREVVDNALRAGVSVAAVRGIIDSFADAQNTPLLHAADVDPRLGPAPAAEPPVADNFPPELTQRSG